MSMSQRLIKIWLIIAGYSVVSIASLILPFVLRADDSRTGITTNSILALLAMSIVSLIFGMLLYRVWSPPALRQARKNGVPAPATVITVTPTGWRARGNASGRGWRVKQGGISKHSAYRSHEYKITVQVNRPDMPPYEAVLFQMLDNDKAPKPGNNIMVKVHPQRADVVVIPENSDAM